MILNATSIENRVFVPGDTGSRVCQEKEPEKMIMGGKRAPTGSKLKINCREQCDTPRCGLGGERSLGYKQPDKMAEGTG